MTQVILNIDKNKIDESENFKISPQVFTQNFQSNLPITFTSGKTQYFVTIDGVDIGYIYKQQYAREFICSRFEQAINQSYNANKIGNFRVKIEKKDNLEIYKLYYLSQGNIWNSTYKLMTAVIEPINRIALN